MTAAITTHVPGKYIAVDSTVMPRCVSVIMPVYNEFSSVERVVTLVLRQTTVQELVIVDDCSTDGSEALLRSIAEREPRVRLIRHKQNRGKGAALRTGLAAAAGDILLIQDADLEYDPEQYPLLIAPILDGKADVVYGSRFLGGGTRRVLYYWHSLGNRFLTELSNILTDLNLSDMETCYKVFKREVIQSITIEEDRFGFEPEITAKVSRRKLRVYEVPISYNGRTYAEGKKIGWRDGVRALWCILKYNLKR